MRAGTKFAVLSLLLERPSYGYEVLLRFRRAFGPGHWEITPQGLYAALDRLEREDLIEPVDERARGTRRRQPKTSYRVTSAGAEALHRFLETPIGPDPSRAEFLVRLQYAATRDAETLLALLEVYEHACLEELSRLAAMPEAGGAAAQLGTLAERLALEDRRLALQARLLWIDFARQQLRSGDDPDPQGPRA